jgi:hypothetical protein
MLKSKVRTTTGELLQESGLRTGGVRSGREDRKTCMESQEGHNPDLDWRGKSAKPYGNRTVSVRIPYGFRTVSVRIPYGFARIPYGIRTESVRFPYGFRTVSVRIPYGFRTVSVRIPYGFRTVLND